MNTNVKLLHADCIMCVNEQSNKEKTILVNEETRALLILIKGLGIDQVLSDLCHRHKKIIESDLKKLQELTT